MGLPMGLPSGLTGRVVAQAFSPRPWRQASYRGALAGHILSQRSLQSTVASGHLEEEYPTHITTLPNGVRVASVDNPGHFISIGVYVDAGTRFETDRTAGASHVLQHLAFKSTKNLPAKDLMQRLESMGGSIFANSVRESISYQASVFPNDLKAIVELFAEIVQRPLIPEDEVEEAKENTRFEISDMEWKMDVVLPERVHEIAFSSIPPAEDARSKMRSLFRKEKEVEAAKTPLPSSPSLGRPLLCNMDTISRLAPEAVREFHSTWYTPDRIVLAAVGVSHETLVELAALNFGDMLPATPETKALQAALSVPSRYVGGTAIEDTINGPRSPNPDDRLLTHLHIAFEAPHMADPDAYALATLTSLMGGGGSFSAGGPGKGMYTRLYTQVLNQYNWVEGCYMTSFTYNDTGIFGISASAPPSFQIHEHIGPILCHQLYQMTQGYTDEELSRAKNQLKSSLLMALESRATELDDLARQALAHGRRIGVREMCRRVDSLTADDLIRVARRVVAGSDEPSPLNFGDGEFARPWRAQPMGKPTVLVHGPLVGGRSDPLRSIDKTVRDWGLGRA